MAPVGTVVVISELNGVYHGFLRTSAGSFTTIGPSGSVQTVVVGLSLNQTVAGLYFDSSGLVHGFLSLDGTTTSYDAPNASGTATNNINPVGVIAGPYYDSAGVMHGYVRDPNGTYLEFDAPGAGTDPSEGTSANWSDLIGRVTGNYVDSNNVNQGFLLE